MRAYHQKSIRSASLQGPKKRSAPVSGGVRRLGDRLSRWVGGGVLATAVIAVAGLAETTVASDGVTSAPTASARASMLRRDWIDDVIDVLDDVADDLDEADDAINGGGVTGSVSQLGLPPMISTYVLGRLDDVLVNIDILFDPGVGPTVDVSLGSVDPTVQPETLEEYASVTLRLAEDALDHVLNAPVIDEAYVASLLRTIEHLICREEPHCYRSKAAPIEQGGHPSA